MSFHPLVSARVQGGRRVQALAIGRLGAKQFLVRYTIGSGAMRERWLPADRVQGDAAELAALPAYRRVVCPAVKFEQPAPLIASAADWYRIRLCAKCGKHHNLKHGRTGLMQLLLGIVPVEVSK